MTGFPLHLRRASPDDAGTVHALLAAAGRALAEQGFRNWDPPYPLERVARDVAEREVWLAERGERAVATYTLAPAPVRPYVPAPWRDVAAPALYLNRLAVDPSLQGQGFGAACLAAIDVRAAALGARAIRCDVLAANARLCACYERHGYERRGERAHSGWTFACYERLTPA